MSQRHGYLYKANTINTLGHVTFFFNNVTHFLKNAVLSRLSSVKERHTNFS